MWIIIYCISLDFATYSEIYLPTKYCWQVIADVREMVTMI